MKLPWSKSSSDPINEFWTWFASAAPTLDLMKPNSQQEIGRRLSKIKQGLVWGGSPGQNGKPTKFEICAGGSRDLIPVVKAVVDAAPQIPNWEFVAFRQPSKTFTMRAGSQTITPDVVFWMDKGRSSGLVDITVYVPLPDENARENLGFIALDHAVGEFLVMTRLGKIQFEEASRRPPDSRPLTELGAYLTL